MVSVETGKEPPKNGPEEKKGLFRSIFGYFGKNQEGEKGKEIQKDSPFSSKDHQAAAADIESL